ncbi:MAG: hypothetical protein WC897_04495 [Candidatus Gracilibacteria bacterium]
MACHLRVGIGVDMNREELPSADSFVWDEMASTSPLDESGVLILPPYFFGSAREFRLNGSPLEHYFFKWDPGKSTAEFPEAGIGRGVLCGGASYSYPLDVSSLALPERIANGRGLGPFTFQGLLSDWGGTIDNEHHKGYTQVLRKITRIYYVLRGDACVSELASPALEDLFAQIIRRNDGRDASDPTSPEDLTRIFGERILDLFESRRDDIIERYSRPLRVKF